MGFTTGFTGGVTLTLGVAYLAIITHERNRQAQALALRSQSRVLLGLLEPSSVPPPQNRSELAREERSTIVEAIKDRWNEEIENAVRRVQRTDWNEVREGMEGAIGRLIGGGLQKSRDGIDDAETRAGPKLQEALEKIKGAARMEVNQSGAGIANAISEQEDAKSGARSSWDRGVEKSQGTTETFEKSSGKAPSTGAGTVDAARRAVRNVVTRGIERGKEAIVKAQTVADLSTEKMESKIEPSTTGVSIVEQALNERYEKPCPPNKTVQETLEERYKPIDSRDHTVLRGV